MLKCLGVFAVDLGKRPTNDLPSILNSSPLTPSVGRDSRLTYRMQTASTLLPSGSSRNAA